MKSKMKTYQCSSSHKGFGFGVVVILVGLILLALNFGWLNMALKPIIFSWPMLFIVFGIVALFHRKIVSVLLFWGMGTFFLLPQIALIYPDLLPGINGDFTSIYWPVLLVLAGIMFLMRCIFPRKEANDCFKHNKFSHSRQSTIIEDENIDIFNKKLVFAGEEHIFLDELFPGGRINLVFSGIKIDLRKTKLADGDTYLYVDSVFGGTTLFVPDNWNIIFEVDKVAGGTDDKRFIDSSSVDPSRRLIIKGSCVFSGIEIR